MTWQMALSFISGVTTLDLPPDVIANVLRIYDKNLMRFIDFSIVGLLFIIDYFVLETPLYLYLLLYREWKISWQRSLSFLKLSLPEPAEPDDALHVQSQPDLVPKIPRTVDKFPENLSP